MQTQSYDVLAQVQEIVGEIEVDDWHAYVHSSCGGYYAAREDRLGHHDAPEMCYAGVCDFPTPAAALADDRRLTR